MSGKIKRFLVIVIISAAILFFWAEIFLIMRESKVLAERDKDVTARLDAIAQENDGIRNDISYYLNPANLEKVLREKFNYKNPGEKMIIVVPGQ